MSKSKRQESHFLEDILDSIAKIEKYTDGLTAEMFQSDEMVIDAVVRNFEIIGEAVANISDETKSLYSEVEWKEARGFRNILAHAYFGVDVESFWETTQNNLPQLKEHIQKVLNNE